MNQTDARKLLETDAALAGFIEVYNKLGLQALELVKGKRALELRIGELLGPAQIGGVREGTSLAGEVLERHLRHRFRMLAANRSLVLDRIDLATEPDEITRAALLKAIHGAHVGKNTGESEWYTPAKYIEAARNVMGGISLDPASNETANSVVGAESYYTEEDDGLAQNWTGTVWMNPPYSQPLISLFAEKLVESVESGDVTQACVLVNNATETVWFQTIAGRSSAICFPMGRVQFWHPERKAVPLQGQAVMYLGTRTDLFLSEFAKFGVTLRANEH